MEAEQEYPVVDEFVVENDFTKLSIASDEDTRKREAVTAFERNDQETSDLSDADNTPSPNSSMTTKEHQEYWRKVNCQLKPVKLLFDIPSSRIAEDCFSKYVMYQVFIIKSGSFDCNKVFIERRYSDFERLHRSLWRDFKEEMEEITFPKKRLTGNFTEEMINERKLAFRDYLGSLYSIKCIQRSKQFIDFFTRAQLVEAYGCLRGGQYTKALEILLKTLPLQEKLTQHSASLIVPSLCAILVCHKDLENFLDAHEVGEKALALLQKHSRHKYYIPLLEAMIALAYVLGKDFVFLQEKLEESKVKKDQSKVLTLKELAVKEYVR
ncbi:sorting nexin-20 isoform X1 [Microcaecilia unicolor]|uniref:Sorting nexin-20 isoform X1 n=2 Tax=Microcaecilia unicolor TaxID=1415580 RepID=A0A6P7XXQ6_9AMPH|nr:sorting nexin-20 isoform X1 [Microcaecilia unicolor]XP_030060198.1 sorting nexin-20 isoform X1 [Microcaecilia unicolor]XP_030060199.1 sorting nexin-20 isoform X1 [Microcaecilia unicolor]XP_030060200.1 sorting nexin-20 isoform X1 [Microcaecilia unicolor]